MSVVERFLPGVKDIGLKASEYTKKRRAEGSVDEEGTRIMIEADVSKYVARVLLLDDVPTVSDFQREYDEWEELEYTDIIEAAIEIEKDLQSGRRRRH